MSTRHDTRPSAAVALERQADRLNGAELHALVHELARETDDGAPLIDGAKVYAAARRLRALGHDADTLIDAVNDRAMELRR